MTPGGLGGGLDDRGAEPLGDRGGREHWHDRNRSGCVGGRRQQARRMRRAASRMRVIVAVGMYMLVIDERSVPISSGRPEAPGRASRYSRRRC